MRASERVQCDRQGCTDVVIHIYIYCTGWGTAVRDAVTLQDGEGGGGNMGGASLGRSGLIVTGPSSFELATKLFPSLRRALVVFFHF